MGSTPTLAIIFQVSYELDDIINIAHDNENKPFNFCQIILNSDHPFPEETIFNVSNAWHRKGRIELKDRRIKFVLAIFVWHFAISF